MRALELMLRFAVGVFTFVTILAAILFLAEPEPSGLVGFTMSIPHWPARVLRWLVVGRFADGFVVPFADWLLYLIGGYPLVHAVILCAVLGAVQPFIAGGFADRTEPLMGDVPATSGARAARFFALALVLLIGFPFVSAWLSGMHLSRLSSRLEARGSQRARVWAAADLFMGAEPLNEDAAPRTIQRLARISGDPSLGSVDLPADDPLAARVSEIDQSFEKLRALVGKRAASSGHAQALTLTAYMEFSLRLQLPALLQIASKGRGGDPDQTWRWHRFDAPLGPITVRTNFLPPDRRLIPLLPGAFAGGTRAAATTIKQAAEGYAAADQTARRYFAHVDEIAGEFDLNDTVVRMWYSTLSGYYGTRLFLEGFVGDPVRGQLADSDLYGELTVNLHNSCDSYGRAVGQRVSDFVAAGVYIPVAKKGQEIHVWMNERAYERFTARATLDMLAGALANLGTRDENSSLESEIVGAVAAANPPDRISEILSHELTHWAVHASFASMPWLGLDRSVAFQEGLALVMDNLHLEMSEADLERVLSSIHPKFGALVRGARRPDLATLGLYENADPGLCPAYTPRTFDWTCVWFDQTTHPAHSAHQLAALSRERFFDPRVVQAHHADAWALVRLFGPSILTEAASHRRPIRDVIAGDPFFSTPWRVMQKDVRFASRQLPKPVAELFERCR